MAKTGAFSRSGVFVLLCIASCGWQRAPSPTRAVASTHEPGSPRGEAVAPRASAAPSLELTLYFANPAYTRTGDESLPRLLIEQRSVPRTVRVAEAALRELLEVGPRQGGGEPVAGPGLRARVVRIVDGVATVDFAREGLGGGSLAETQLLSAIVWTLTELPTVQAVQLTVAGRPIESLFGHVDASRPLHRADFPR